MKFQEILTLLKHNPNASDWHAISKGNASIGYCLEDVNLRLALLTVRKGRPHLEIEILYAATTIFSFDVPNASKSEEKSQFVNALNFVMTMTVQGKKPL